MSWTAWPPAGAELFRALRTPGVGEKIVLDDNQFLARSFANGVKRGLTDEERAVYYAPYTERASRLPMLQWPREIPIDGTPADVTAVVDAYGKWLATSPNVPKLLLTFDAPTPLGAPEVVAWARETFAALDVVSLGTAGHHASEDLPHEIGNALATWMAQHRLNAAR
jgi:haloalkane dehalogenase